MKKLLLISMFFGAVPVMATAQDDLYFVPKKKSAVKVLDSSERQNPDDTGYIGSTRNIDEYNRRQQGSCQVIDGDSALSDVIDFRAEKGVYPDSVGEDFELTKKMSRFDDYQLADNAAFWAGYQAGLDTWNWHSPWYYSRYGWYGGWYDPWFSPYYYGSWRYGWYDPWYNPWYDPWYYGYAGWYDPWYYGHFGWGYPHYWGGYYPGFIGGGGKHYAHIGTGTIRRDGSTRRYYHGGAVAGNANRTGSLRERAGSMGGSRTYSSGNNVRSNSGNFSGYRGGTDRSTGSFNNSRNSGSGSSFGGSRSNGGGFGGGGGFSGGGSRGGGGSRMGGRR